MKEVRDFTGTGALIWHRFGAAVAVLAVAACAPQTRVVEVPTVVEKVVEVPRVVEVKKEVRVPVEVSVTDCDIPDLGARSTYVVEAWGVPDETFSVGEALALQVRVSAPSYLTLFHVGTSCKVTRLLHNVQAPMGRVIDFPRRGSGMAITMKPPGGPEGFYFVATKQPLVFLSATDILAESGGVATLDMAPRQFYERLVQARGRVNPADWALKTLRTSVVQH